MKSIGSIVQFTDRRNQDIMNNFRRIHASSPKASILHIATLIANSPAARFWVSEERAAIVISAMVAGRDIRLITGTKQEMFQEIFRRYQILKKRFPHISLSELVSAIVNQPAPKFYYTPKTIAEFIHRILRGYYKKSHK